MEAMPRTPRHPGRAFGPRQVPPLALVLAAALLLMLVPAGAAAGQLDPEPEPDLEAPAPVAEPSPEGEPTQDTPPASDSQSIPAPPPGTPPFHSAGARLLDANDQEVRLTGVNWFGFETESFSPHGLWARNYEDM